MINQYIVMNKETGQQAIGIRFVPFEDHVMDNLSIKNYSVIMVDNDAQFWLICSGEDQPFIAIWHQGLINQLEVVCKL